MCSFQIIEVELQQNPVLQRQGAVEEGGGSLARLKVSEAKGRDLSPSFNFWNQKSDILYK